ncbi:MAG: serine/threonine-protein kinase [Gemmatimonadaceae bacterium]
MPTNPEASARDRSWRLVMERLRVVVRDEYEVLALLGFGGMAGVFLAQERRLRRRVALKVMSPEIMADPGMIERFHQEAVTQANLEHPNIAAVHAVREQGGLYFFAMQYVPGRTLQGALRKELDLGRLLDVSVVRTLLHQVGSALEHAHGAGVIHRDVKPGNVLLAADGRAVVTDFGIAKVAEGPSLTMTGLVQGTASYMSPEQCYAASLTGASDQYSLGVVAYELVTGSVPFTGDAFSVMQAHAGTEAPVLTSIRADCPPELAATVQRMLAKRPEHRFPTILAALESMGATSLSPRRDDPVRVQLMGLADCDGVLASLGDDVKRAMLTPRSSEILAISDHAARGLPGSVTGTAAATHGIAIPPPIVQEPSSGTQRAARSRAIEIVAHPAVIALGERLTLHAVCRDAAGAPVADYVVWSVDAMNVAAIDSAGELLGQQWGRVRVRATVNGLMAESLVIVGSVPLRQVEVIGVPERMVAGSAVAFGVRLVDMSGQERAIPVVLSTSDPTILLAEPPGVARALAPGRAEIIVACGSHEKRLTVHVTNLT